MVIHILRDALEKKEDIGKAVFRGIMLSYLTGLSQEDFNRLWRSARRNFREMEFDRYLTDWKKDIVIRKEDSTILFDGIKLPKSKDGGNVNKEDIILFDRIRAAHPLVPSADDQDAPSIHHFTWI